MIFYQNQNVSRDYFDLGDIFDGKFLQPFESNWNILFGCSCFSHHFSLLGQSHFIYFRPLYYDVYICFTSWYNIMAQHYKNETF